MRDGDASSLGVVAGRGGGARTSPSGVAKSSLVTTRPADSTSTVKVTTRMVGSFFGENGIFDTVAREITRASAGEELSESRAVASRYLAR